MLVTFEDLKTLYGMPSLKESDRPQYENLLLTAEEEVLEYAGLEKDGDAQEFFEGDGKKGFLLLLKPIKEVVSVTVGGEPVPYRYNERTHMVTLSSPAYAEVVVDECLGFEETPRIIYKAIAETVQYWVKYINSNMVGVTSRSTDLGTETLEQWELPQAVKSALGRFRHAVI